MSIDISELVEFRRNRQTVSKSSADAFIGLTIDGAYDLQQQVINDFGVVVAGWKLGGTNSKTRALMNVNELYWGAVFEGQIGSDITQQGLFKGEVELAFKFSKEIENFHSNDRGEDLAAYIKSVALSVEFPWSVFNDFGEAGVVALIADCCASGFCLLGEEIEFGRYRGKSNVNVEVDGTLVETGSSDVLICGVEETLGKFIDRAVSRGFELKEDQWVFSGGITTCRTFSSGSTVVVNCNNLPGLTFITP